jgi:hypothetical protein
MVLLEGTKRKRKKEGSMPTNLNQTQINQLVIGKVTMFLAQFYVLCSSKKVIYVASLVEMRPEVTTFYGIQ